MVRGAWHNMVTALERCEFKATFESALKAMCADAADATFDISVQRETRLGSKFAKKSTLVLLVRGPDAIQEFQTIIEQLMRQWDSDAKKAKK